MSTERFLNPKHTSSFQAIIKTVFYGNNVRKVNLKECYELASKQPGVIVTDHPMYKAKEMGLPADAKVLVVNDGSILGRTAKARVLVPKMGADKGKYETILREAVYDMGNKPLIYANAYMGLDTDCMIRVHYLTTE